MYSSLLSRLVFMYNYVYLECQNVAVSSGITEQDSINLKKVIMAVPEIDYICLDVANGYTEHFVQFVKNTRATYPNKTIIVSFCCCCCWCCC